MNDTVVLIFIVGVGVFGIALAAAVLAVIAPENSRSQPGTSGK